MHGLEVRGLPWRPDHLEISIIPRSVLLKRSAHRRAARTLISHTYSGVLSRIAESGSREISPGGIDLRTGVIGFLRCVPTLLKVTARMNASDTTPPNRSIFVCECVPKD